MIGSSQPKVLSEFYGKIFDKTADYTDDSGAGWSVGGCFLMVGEHSEVRGESKEPSRFMFNLETKEVKEEYDRMVKAGATSVKEPYEMGGGWVATLADPDGNYFQLMTPWEEKK